MRDEKIMNALINVRIFDYENYIESGYVVFDEHVQEVGKMSEFKNKGYKSAKASIRAMSLAADSLWLFIWDNKASSSSFCPVKASHRSPDWKDNGPRASSGEAMRFCQ